MKLSFLLFILINTYLIIQVSSIVRINEFITRDKTRLYGSYYDLLYLQLECPHKGALKNFFVKYNNNTTWYQFICYSSLQINQMNIL